MRKYDYYAKKNTVRKKFMKITIMLFIFLLLLIGFIGLLFPLRPKVSEVEKRELTKFPKPTAATFMNGEFFSDISTWYADTFPFRETLSSANAKVKKLYGITTEELHGEAVQGDEIPDPDAEITSTPIPTDTPTPTPGPDGTIHAEPEKAGQIYIVDNRGFELYGFSRAGADAYINMINTAATQLKELAQVMGSSHQNVKQLLLKLQDASYVNLLEDEKDKRKQRVVITEQGKKFCKKYDKPSDEFIQCLYQDVEASDVLITIKTITTMENNLKKGEWKVEKDSSL